MSGVGAVTMRAKKGDERKEGPVSSGEDEDSENEEEGGAVEAVASVPERSKKGGENGEKVNLMELSNDEIAELKFVQTGQWLKSADRGRCTAIREKDESTEHRDNITKYRRLLARTAKGKQYLFLPKKFDDIDNAVGKKLLENFEVRKGLYSMVDVSYAVVELFWICKIDLFSSEEKTRTGGMKSVRKLMGAYVGGRACWCCCFRVAIRTHSCFVWDSIF